MKCLPSRRPANPGFTLIEVVVVLAVIGILASLTLVGLSQARESARRLECSNRLKQFGIALHSFQTQHSNFPAPMPYRVPSRGTMFAMSSYFSGFYELLPHLELTGVYNSLNLGGSPHVLGPENIENATVFHARLGQFLCPSETRSARFSSGPNSYRFNVGSSNPLQLKDVSRSGAFDALDPLTPADYRDGLSTTVGMSERLLGGADEDSFDARRDFWSAGVYPSFPMETDDSTLAVCRSLSGTPSRFQSDLGRTWMMGGATFVWYNHVAPPNNRAPDCVTGDVYSDQGTYCETCSLDARSSHSGGVNCLFMDGSVKFIQAKLATAVWRALGTRAGGDASTGF